MCWEEDALLFYDPNEERHLRTLVQHSAERRTEAAGRRRTEAQAEAAEARAESAEAHAAAAESSLAELERRGDCV